MDADARKLLGGQYAAASRGVHACDARSSRSGDARRCVRARLCRVQAIATRGRRRAERFGLASAVTERIRERRGD